MIRATLVNTQTHRHTAIQNTFNHQLNKLSHKLEINAVTLPFTNVVDSRRLDNNGFEFIWQTLSTEKLQRPVPVVVVELTERLTAPANTHIITNSTTENTQLVR